MTKSLPIDALRPAFDAAMATGKPLVVTAPTGSGKSTRLPLWMAEALGGAILVVEPRRVACRALAAHLAAERGEVLGDPVGYRVRFEERWKDGGRLLFVTPGVALRMLDEGGLAPFAGVMIDEFHERRWDCDLLLTLLRLGRDRLPLLLTSATLDGRELAAGLDGVWLEGTGRLHPVRILHEGTDGLPASRDLDERVRRGVERVLAEEPEGDVLVFLPGKGEIERCHDALQDAARAAGVELVRVHGSMPLDRLNRALAPHGGRRRVLLSTNVAETSLTLPGVRAVVDSGLVRMRRHRGGRAALVLEAIAADAMVQRAGRAGRVAPGLCLRLWGRSFRPEAGSLPEIRRCELDDCLLRGAASGLDLGRWERAPWPTAPPAFAVEEAVTRLQALGALDEKRRITGRGRGLLRLPVSVHEARLLADPPAALAGLLCDLVAILQGRGRLLPPPEGAPCPEMVAARRTLVRAWDDEVGLSLALLRGGDDGAAGANRSALDEIRSVSTALRELLGLSGTDPRKDAPPERGELEALARHLLLRWPEAAFMPRARAARGRGRGKRGGGRGPESHPWSNGGTELFVRPHATWLEAAERGRPLPKAALVLDVEWIAGDGRHGPRGAGRLLLPCRPEDLAVAGLGTWELAEPVLVRDGNGTRIRALRRRRFADGVLEEEEAVLRGAELRGAAARFILDGLLLGGGGARFLDDLHLLRMLCAWPGNSLHLDEAGRRLAGRADEEILAGRLAALGVEEGPDLDLLEEEDLALHGALRELWDGEDPASLRRDFPRLWSHRGAIFRCEVDGVSGVVDLVAVNGAARSLRELPVLVLPGFRRFRVRLRRGQQLTPLR